MIFYTIRHTQTEWHLTGQLQGHLDSPLTTLGQKNAKEIGEKLKDKKIDLIYSSDLGRCKETSEIISSILEIPIIFSEKLREQNFGIYNGKFKKDIYPKIKLNDEKFTPKNGESFNKMQIRFLEEIQKILTQNPNKTILFVIHDGGIRAILSDILHCHFTNEKCKTSTKTISKFQFSNQKINLITRTESR